MSYQKIVGVGNLGTDPEMRYLPSGKAVTNFSVAANNTYVNKDGERVSQVTWFRVSVFGKQAESCNEYLKKGSLVLVEGRLNPDKDTGGPRIWKTESGEARASFDVTANDVRFLGKKE